MKKLYVAGAIFLLCGLHALPVYAEEPPQVYISEINWAGSSLTTADEWLELYNPHDQTVDLSGWILTGSATSREALAIAEGTEILAQDVLVISNYPLGHEKTTLNIESDLVTSSLSLPNSGLEIMLTDPDGIVVDQVSFSSTPEAGLKDPIASAVRDLTTDSWQTATTSNNLLDSEQSGSPGMIEFIESTILDEEDPVEEPPEDEENEENTDEGNDPEEEEPAETDDPAQDETIIEDPPDEPVEVIEEPIQVTAPVTFASGTVLINEFVSDPIDTVEWIELYNPQEAEIDLTDWFVRDASGKETALRGKIEAASYFVIEHPSGKLNNDGDTIYLFDPSSHQIDSIEYGENVAAPEKGESLALTEASAWQITNLITKETANQFPEPEIINQTEYEVHQEAVIENQEDEPADVSHPEPESSPENPELSSEPKVHHIVAIAEPEPDETISPKKRTSTEPKDVTAVQTGQITALPGTFGSQIAFIDGIQLYFYYADWPELEIGDLVRVEGELSVSRGEERIKISSQENLKITGHTEPTVHQAAISEVSTYPEGALVQITGQVLERNGDKLVVGNEAEEITLVAHKNTNLSWSDLQSSTITVTGVVRKMSDGVRVYPRSQEDVKEQATLLNETTAASTGTISISRTTDLSPYIGGGLILIVVSALTFWYVRAKKLNLIPQTK